MKQRLRVLGPAIGLLSTLACLALPARGLYAKRSKAGAPAARRYACEAFAAHHATLTAKAGDTLWALTGQNTGKPWVWPQIWALNPELANPHWLVVGQQVHFAARPAQVASLASNMPAPAEVEAEAEDSTEAAAEMAAAPAVASAAAQPAASPASEPVPPAAAPKAQATKPKPPAARPEAPTAEVQKRGRRFAPADPVAPLGSRLPYACLPAAFFSYDELGAFGTLVRSSSDGLLWRQGDAVEIRWPDAAKAGPGPWAVVRVAEGTDSFDNAASAGVIGTCTGVIKARGTAANQAEVVMAREELGVGQRLVPLSAMAPSEPPFTPTAASACGQVLALEHAALAGSPLHLVFINLGTSDGVRLGSELVGPGQGRGAARRARLRVVQVGAHTATAAAVTSPAELAVGERFCGLEQPQS